MRSKANSTLGFGMLAIAVQVFKSTDQHGVSLHQYHAGGCLGEIGNRKYCKTCGAVDDLEIAKGVANDDGQLVLITSDELAEVEREETGDEIEILAFVPAEQIKDQWLDGAADYLAPHTDVKRKGAGIALKGFTLLRDALEHSDRVGVVKYVRLGAAHIAVLRVQGKVLTLQDLVWAADVRAPEFPVLDREVVVTPKETKMAQTLVESMLGDFEHAQYVDHYAVAVEKLVEDKAAGAVPMPASAEETGTADVSDLLAALTASIKAKALAKSVAAHPAGRKRAKKGAAA